MTHIEKEKLDALNILKRKLICKDFIFTDSSLKEYLHIFDTLSAATVAGIATHDAKFINMYYKWMTFVPDKGKKNFCECFKQTLVVDGEDMVYDFTPPDIVGFFYDNFIGVGVKYSNYNNFFSDLKDSLLNYYGNNKSEFVDDEDENQSYAYDNMIHEIKRLSYYSVKIESKKKKSLVVKDDNCAVSTSVMMRYLSDSFNHVGSDNSLMSKNVTYNSETCVYSVSTSNTSMKLNVKSLVDLLKVNDVNDVKRSSVNKWLNFLVQYISKNHYYKDESGRWQWNNMAFNESGCFLFIPISKVIDSGMYQSFSSARKGLMGIDYNTDDEVSLDDFSVARRLRSVYVNEVHSKVNKGRYKFDYAEDMTLFYNIAIYSKEKTVKTILSAFRDITDEETKNYLASINFDCRDDYYIYVAPNTNFPWFFLMEEFGLLPQYAYELDNISYSLLYYLCFLLRNRLDAIVREGYIETNLDNIVRYLGLTNYDDTDYPKRRIFDVIENSVNNILKKDVVNIPRCLDINITYSYDKNARSKAENSIIRITPLNDFKASLEKQKNRISHKLLHHEVN